MSAALGTAAFALLYAKGMSALPVLTSLPMARQHIFPLLPLHRQLMERRGFCDGPNIAGCTRRRLAGCA